MIVFKVVASLALILLIAHPLSSNDCCPWTPTCKCPKGEVIVESPWECTKLTLKNREAKVAFLINAALKHHGPILEPEITCKETNIFSKAYKHITVTMLLVSLVICVMVVCIQFINWFNQDDEGEDRQQNERNAPGFEVYHRNRHDSSGSDYSSTTTE